VPRGFSGVAGFRQNANPLSRTTIWVFGCFAVVQGAGIVTGGPDRWQSPGFTVLRQVPHSTQVFGWSAVLLGVAILVGSATRTALLKGVGVFLLSVWSLSFAVGSFIATATVPAAATTGGPVYLAVSMALVPLIFVDERERTRSPWSRTPSSTTSETS
jgi:uncharacterized membrane protein